MFENGYHFPTRGRPFDSGGGRGYVFCEEKIVQQVMENKQFVQLLVEKNSFVHELIEKKCFSIDCKEEK